MEALDHAVAEQRVGERHQRHAGVVREEGADDRACRRCVGRRPLAAIGVVDRSKKPYSPNSPASASRRRFVGAARRIDHHGERRGVRRDDQLVAQAALQPEPGHAERLVLIVAVRDRPTV